MLNSLLKHCRPLDLQLRAVRLSPSSMVFTLAHNAHYVSPSFERTQTRLEAHRGLRAPGRDPMGGEEGRPLVVRPLPSSLSRSFLSLPQLTDDSTMHRRGQTSGGRMEGCALPSLFLSRQEALSN